MACGSEIKFKSLPQVRMLVSCKTRTLWKPNAAPHVSALIIERTQIEAAAAELLGN